MTESLVVSRGGNKSRWPMIFDNGTLSRTACPSNFYYSYLIGVTSVAVKIIQLFFKLLLIR